MEDSLIFLAQQLLYKTKIRIDNDEFIFQIKSHSSFPSIHAVTGVYSHFNIENAAIQVPVNEEVLSQLPTYFLAQINTKKGKEFVLVTRKKLTYNLLFNKNKREQISLKKFLEQFTGILIAVEKDETVSQPSKNKKNYTNLFAATAIVLFVALFFIQEPSLIPALYFISSLAGVVFSILIIQHNLGISSKILDTVCSQDNKATNCNAVLNSKGATLFKALKLSDISFIYFATLSISAVLISISKVSYDWLLLISLTAIPAIFYSIYYQLAIVKNVCVLCLCIVSVLLIQVGTLFSAHLEFSTIKVDNSLVILLFSLTSVTSTWLFLSSKIKKEIAFESLKIESAKFKKNFDLFNTLLQTSSPMGTTLPKTEEIVFGNRKATLNLVVITNPFCGPCKAVHQLVEDILTKYHNDIAITIRFNISTTNKDSDPVKVASRLLEIYNSNGEAACLKAMHDIYTNTDANLWLSTWTICRNPDYYVNILSTQNNWCISNKIDFTPELLINGNAFPKAYDRNDLIYFIEELAECYNPNINSTYLKTYS